MPYSGRKGNALLSVLLCMSFLLIMGTGLARIFILFIKMPHEKLKAVKVFYLAEAGIEMSKSRIAANDFYFTDLPHAEYDKQWLLAAASGETFLLGEGGFKIVKEQNKFFVYSIGFLGNDIRKSNYYCWSDFIICNVLSHKSISGRRRGIKSITCF